MIGPAPLELLAMRWLKYEQKCALVLCERSPKYGMGSPDVLGVKPSRYLTEIEIKRSLSDFRADFQKPHRANYELTRRSQARQFYYLVPKELAEKVKPRLPMWAGLMYGDPNNWLIQVVKTAPNNEPSTKLTLKECVRLMNQLSNHALGLAHKTEEYRRIFEWGKRPWHEPDYEI